MSPQKWMALPNLNLLLRIWNSKQMRTQGKLPENRDLICLETFLGMSHSELSLIHLSMHAGSCSRVTWCSSEPMQTCYLTK